MFTHRYAGLPLVALIVVASTIFSAIQCSKREPAQVNNAPLPPKIRPRSIPEGETDDWTWDAYLANETLEYPDEPGGIPFRDEVYYSEEESESMLREGLGNGVNFTSMGPATAGHALSFSREGKVLVVGRTHNGTHNNYALFRYSPDGSLDTSFGTIGRLSVDFGNGRGEVAHAYDTGALGKIVAVGRYNFGVAPGNYFIWSIARFHSDGLLDTAFASTGQVLINFNSLNAVARAVKIQNDGKVTIAGYAATQLDSVGPAGSMPPYYQKQYDAVLVRLNSNGMLDTSLGSNGIIFASHAGAGTKMDGYYTLGLPNDGKIVAGGFRDDGTNVYEGLVARYTTTGALDAAFNGTGIVTINSSSAGRDVINALVLPTDNKIVVAGFSHNGSNFDFYTGRINSNGTMDNTFNGAGGHRFDIGAGRDDFGMAVTLQDDGKIIVAGKTFGSANYDIALARYNTNGSLDTTNFGTTGKAISTAGAGDDLAYGVAYNSSTIMIAGTTGVGVNNQSIVIRYNTDGTIATSGRLDKSFGTLGFVTASIGTTVDNGLAAMAQPDGKMIVVGYSTIGGKDHFGLARFRQDGFLDTSFGTTTGTAFTSFATVADQASAIAIAQDGVFVVGGYTAGNGNDMAIARYRTDGILDSSFSADGRLVLSLTTREDYIHGLAFQTDGRIIIAGTEEPANNTFYFSVLRLTTTGILDTSFASTGFYNRNPSGREDRAYAAALQSDGKIVAAGTAEYAANNNWGWMVTRLSTNGLIDTTFGTTIAGATILEFGGADEAARSILPLPDGRIIVAGYANPGNNYGFVVARFSTTGILDTSFASIGSAIIQLTANSDQAFKVDIQPNGKILLVGVANNGANDDIGIVRLNSNGTLDTTLGSNGTIVLSVGTGADQGYGSVLTTDGRIMIGGTIFRSNNDFGVVRVWP